MKRELWIGSYAGSESESIYKVKLDDESGRLEKAGSFSGVENPSWLLQGPEKRLLYSVEELSPAGLVSGYLKEEEGHILTYRKSLVSGGADPCHLSLDPSGRFLVVSNYSSGSLSVIRLSENGTPGEQTQHIQHVGHSTDPIRQTHAHVHFTIFAGGKLWCCDLGEDKVYCYDFDPEEGKLTECAGSFTVPEGYGPRHIAVHENHDILYVMCEMAAKILVVKREEDSCRILQEISTIPEDAEPSTFVVGVSGSMGAALKFTEDGGLLLASTRGHNSIAVFRPEKDGTLTRLSITQSGGRTPRDFAVIGDYVVCANQDEDLLTVLKLDRESGTLGKTPHQLQISKPVCVLPALL